MEEQIIEQDLHELKKIGNEITQLENKLESLNEPVYNRKQRRQLRRQSIRHENQKKSKLQRSGEVFITRKEFVSLFQSVQKIRDRLYFIDILTASMEKILMSKNIIIEEELQKAIIEENDKAQEFQKLQNGEKDYINRLQKCIELNIDPNHSNIGKQILEDNELALADKIEFAEKFKLDSLLKILKSMEEK